MNPIQGSSFERVSVLVPQYQLSLTAPSISANYFSLGCCRRKDISPYLYMRGEDITITVKELQCYCTTNTEMAHTEMVIKTHCIPPVPILLGYFKYQENSTNNVTFHYIWHVNKLTSQEESERERCSNITTGVLVTHITHLALPAW